jgi:hypothetical protein
MTEGKSKESEKMTTSETNFDLIFEQCGIPAWIKFCPTLHELMKTCSTSICMARSYREGFKAGVEVAMTQVALMDAKKVLDAEQARRN